MSTTEDLVSRLESIEAELADLAVHHLKNAVYGDDPSSASEEREISKARRSVEKAVHILRHASE